MIHTTIINTTDTDAYSIDTWFLLTPIRYLAHVMYYVCIWNMWKICAIREIVFQGWYAHERSDYTGHFSLTEMFASQKLLP